MKKIIAVLSMILMAFGTTVSGADNTFLDYQNYNHGYCPDCNCAPCTCEQPCEPCDTCPAPCSPCDPCAPVCGAECGISLCAIGVAIAALAVAAVLILASGNGSSSSN